MKTLKSLLTYLLLAIPFFAYSQTVPKNPSQFNFFFGASNDAHDFPLTADDVILAGNFTTQTKSDFIIYNSLSGSLVLQKNNSTNIHYITSYYTAVTIPNVTIPVNSSLYVGKFDNNSFDDLAYFDKTANKLYLVLNNGISFAPPILLGTFGGNGNSWNFYIGDFNGGSDGRDDIACYNKDGNYANKIYVGILAGTYSSPTFSTPNIVNVWKNIAPASNSAWQFYVGDFNADGRKDIFSHNPNLTTSNIKTFFSNGSSFNSTVTTGVSLSSTWNFTIGNFTGLTDGDEIVGYRSAVDGKIWIGKPNVSYFPNFKQVGIINTYTDPLITYYYGSTLTASDIIQLKSGDFSGDEKIDIVLYDETDNLIYLGFNYLDQVGFSALPTTYNKNNSFKLNRWSNLNKTNSTSISPDYQKPLSGWLIGEFDGNSRLDLLVYGSNSSNAYSASIGSNFMEVQGYVWPLSVGNDGNSKIDFFTQGYFEPNEELIINSYYSNESPVIEQSGPQNNYTVGINQAAKSSQYFPLDGWKNGYNWNGTTFLVPATWPSGFYKARVKRHPSIDYIPSAALPKYIPFIVKPGLASVKSKIALIANTNTWQSYNQGYRVSKYGEGIAKYGTEEAIYSFMRPWNKKIVDSKGLFAGELWVYSWLDFMGFRPDVYSDIDLQNDLISYLDYKVIVLSTHPEYWTVDMYDNLKKFLDNGGSLLYLGGNGIFEKVKEINQITGQIVFYDGETTFDPNHPNNTNIIGSGNNEWAARGKHLFRNSKEFVNGNIQELAMGEFRPEIGVLGVHTEACLGTHTNPGKPLKTTVGLSSIFPGIGISHPSSIGNSGYNIYLKNGSPIINGQASAWEIDNAHVVNNTTSSQGTPGTNFATGNFGCVLNWGNNPNSSPPYNNPFIDWSKISMARPTPLTVVATATHPTGYINEMVYYNNSNNPNSHVLSAGSITFGGSLIKDCDLTKIVNQFLTTKVGLIPGSYSPRVPNPILADCPQNKSDTGNLQEDIFSFNYKISPNPVVDILEINSTNGTVPKKIEIFNLKGEKLHIKESNKSSKITLDLSIYPSGVYLISIFDKHNEKRFKIVKK